MERDDFTSDTYVILKLGMRNSERGGDEANYREELGHQKTSCACELTIPDIAGSCPDQVGNITNTRSSKLDQALHTPDFSSPLASSMLFPSSFLISLAHPQLDHHHKNTMLSHPCLSLHAMNIS